MRAPGSPPAPAAATDPGRARPGGFRRPSAAQPAGAPRTGRARSWRGTVRAPRRSTSGCGTGAVHAETARREVGGEGEREPDEDVPDADHAAPSCQSRRTVVPWSPVSMFGAAADRGHARDDRRADAQAVAGNALEVEALAGVADLDPHRRLARRRTATVSPSPPACCRAFATPCVAASVSARATRPGHRRRVAVRSIARPTRSAPSSSRGELDLVGDGVRLRRARRCPRRRPARCSRVG